MIDRRDVWHDLEPLVQNTINAAFEKYIPIIVEQCQQHDKIMILRHEAQTNSKRNFALWGIFVSVFNAAITTAFWKFR